VDTKWCETFDELNTWIEKEKKRPNKRAGEENEKRLGIWTTTQKMNYKKKKYAMKDQDKRDKWDKFLQKYEEYMIDPDPDTKWYETYDELKEWIKKNKKRPSSEAKEKHEKKLGAWIGHQQNIYKKNVQAMKDQDKRGKWEEYLQTHKEYMIDIDTKWYETLDKLINWIKDNKKRPSSGAKEENESKMASWIGHQQKNYKKNTDAMKDQDKRDKWTEFSEKYKEYMIDNDTKWSNTLDELKRWIEEHKKRASTTSKDHNEKKLAKWIGHQQDNYKNNAQSMKDQCKRDKWFDFMEKYKEYVIDLDTKWYETLDKLKSWIKENNKKPSTSAKDANEKRLASWINQQQVKYKKNANAMKDHDKRNKLHEFISEHSDMFDMLYREDKKETQPKKLIKRKKDASESSDTSDDEDSDDDDLFTMRKAVKNDVIKKVVAKKNK
jgi:hypothetical protein